jgi:hypothetical protein
MPVVMITEVREFRWRVWWWSVCALARLVSRIKLSQMSTAAAPTADIAPPSFASITAFFKSPSAHMRTKYASPERAQAVTLMVWMALASVFWQILILATVPRAFCFIGLGHLAACYYAVNGLPEGFTHVTYKAWLALEGVFILVTLIGGVQATGGGWWVWVAILTWTALVINQAMTLRRIQ